jgi:hypothetical protein
VAQLFSLGGNENNIINMKYGVQITVTAAHDNAYCVYQLVQENTNAEYKPTGSVIWIDKAKQDPEKRLMDAIQLGLNGGIKTTQSK